jgi:hypothetical protein
LQQLVAAFADSFVNGERFATINSARLLAESILNEKITPGTPAAKFVDEAIEQGLIQAARQLIGQSNDPIRAWEQCLDLYDRQPGLNTRTSTSVSQQAYPCFVTLGRRKIEIRVSQEYKNGRGEAINNRLKLRKTQR